MEKEEKANIVLYLGFCVYGWTRDDFHLYFTLIKQGRGFCTKCESLVNDLIFCLQMEAPLQLSYWPQTQKSSNDNDDISLFPLLHISSIQKLKEGAKGDITCYTFNYNQMFIIP